MTRAVLEAAFRATTYRVTTPAGIFSLRIGVADQAFDAFLRHQILCTPHSPGNAENGIGAGSCWGIVTAHNPGRHLSERENRLAQERLRDLIRDSGLPSLAACNLADDDAWPMEESCLVLGADEEQMRGFGSSFGQLAVVCGRIGAAPRLLWLC